MQRPNTSRRRAAQRAGVARPDSAVAEMTGQSLNCERCAEFSREPRDLVTSLHPEVVAELSKPVTVRSRGSKLWVAAACGLARYPTVLFCLVHLMRPRSKRGRLTEQTQLLTGVVLIALGGLLLVSNAGLAPWFTWNLFWPSLVILTGIGLVAQRPR